MKTHKLFASVFTLFVLAGCQQDKYIPPTTSTSVSQPTSMWACSTSVASITPISGVQNSACVKILIDASHDGGVWWFPQSGSFNVNLQHQGTLFESALRNAGFTVDVLSRNQKVTGEVLSEYNIVFRMSGFEPYSNEEIIAYKDAIDRGITLLLFSDHQKYDTRDEIAELLSIRFEGAIAGSMKVVKDISLTSDLSGVNYLVGSYIVPTSTVQLQTLASIDGQPVMALVDHPKSRVFVMGDCNTIEFLPQPFCDNLMRWSVQQCGIF